jgi:hypothetical protein
MSTTLRVHELKQDEVKSQLRRGMRFFCLPSDAQEMICAALNADEGVTCHVAVDERGIAGAISIQTYADSVHIHALGSLKKGTGRVLVAVAARTAKKMKLPLTVSATERSRAFYEVLGFKAFPAQKPSSLTKMFKA